MVIQEIYFPHPVSIEVYSHKTFVYNNLFEQHFIQGHGWYSTAGKAYLGPPGLLIAIR